MPDEIIKEKKLNTPRGALTVFNIYHVEMKRFGFDLNGKTVLNIGTGRLIGLDLLFLIHGAKRVFSLDLDMFEYEYPHITAQLPFYHRLLSLAYADKTVASAAVDGMADFFSMHADAAVFNTNRLVRLAADAACVPLAESTVDFCFSNAVLEHVEKPARVIAEIQRVLTPGGHTMHRVDLRDHADFSNPLDFLKPGKSSNGCNMWRSCHFETAFLDHHFEMLKYDIFDQKTVFPGEKLTFRTEFSTLPAEELGKLRFMAYAKKPA